MQAVNDQLRVKIADFEGQIRDRNNELEQTQDQVIGKDESIMQLRMELEMTKNEISFEMEDRSFEQKNLKRDFEKAQLQEKKASGEVEWL